jgi:hypothetical protein
VSGLKLISFGPAQNIHMFGIYEVGHSNADLTNHFYEVYRYLRKFTLRRYLENISNYSYIGRIKDLILSR